MKAFRTATVLAAVLWVAVMALPALSQTNERGIDPQNFDTQCKPCEDFYEFANGNWLHNNPIPAEYARWAVWNEIQDRNYELLHEILDDAAADTDAEAGSIKQIVGDFYYTAMDTAQIEAAGGTPLESDFERIDAVSNLDELQTLITDYHRERLRVLFDLDVDQDYKNSEVNMLFVSQGGLGLPEKGYYTRDDDESKELRAKYVEHIANTFKLLGDDDATAKAEANSVMATETELAKASLSRVDLRDPDKQYKPVNIEEAGKATPNWSWPEYFAQLGLPDVQRISMAQPEFFDKMNQMLAETPLDDWKTYVKWNVARAASRYLSKDFVDEDFAFYSKTLRGTEKLEPRWRRFLNMANWYVGEPIGQLYVAQAFPPESKARAMELINNLRAALKDRIEGLQWMGEETKAKALKKVATFTPKIGYPDKWRDYSNLRLDRSSYLANLRKVRAHSMQHDLDKIGKPVDRTEWGMPPQIVNAYYSPSMNEVVFPAAILQPPFFDATIDDAVNYGAIGSIIGHELMHGFDDQGSQFDEKGNYNNWWTEEDRSRFEARTEKLVKQYDDFVAIDDLHVNGKLTLGENIADLGGAIISFAALKKAIAGKDVPKIDGFTQEQRFFLSWAQAWRNNMRPEALKMQVNTDPHSPGRFRANGPLENMTEFREAFGCKDGDPMVRSGDDRVVIW